MTPDPRTARFGWKTAAAYRTIAEVDICDGLLLAGSPRGLESGAEGDDVAEMRRILDRLVALGLPFATGIGGRAFDPVEVSNFCTWIALKTGESLWTDHMVRTGRLRVAHLQTSMGATTSGSAAIAVTLRRTFGASLVPVGVSPRLRLPLPVPDAGLSGSRHEMVETGGLSWRVAPDRSRLEARGPMPSHSISSATIRCEVPAHPASPDAAPVDRALYLRSDDHGPITPRIRTLAAQLAGRNTNPAIRVARFWNFMLNELLFGAIHYDRIPAGSAVSDWVLDTGWFDCQTGSSLLIALCRASGIPARLVGGYLVYPSSPTLHYWTEVWFDDAGWTPYDVLAWDLSAGGRDQAWRDVFAGRLEPRFKTQSFPLHFTGSPGVRFPDRWHIVRRPAGPGAETRLVDVATGALVFSDTVAVALGERPIEPTSS